MNDNSGNWWLHNGYAGDFEQAWADWDKQQKDDSSGQMSFTEVKCECGAHTVYGKDCESWMHQPYCMLYADTRGIK